MPSERQQEFMAIVDKVLDSDELYDLLPGDGQDDYILSLMRKLFKEALA